MNPTIETLLDRVQKPGRYAGGELNSVVKDRDAVRIRFAFCFPDLYEVGMSHLGMKILYGLFNSMEDVVRAGVCARHGYGSPHAGGECPLFGIESGDPVREFDFIGFTLQYEMSFTAVLNMLDLAGLPVRAEERGDTGPIVVAGGPCACNPEPLADFIDLFTLGEGEEVNAELLELYRSMQGPDFSKRAFLKAAARIEGVYVPPCTTWPITMTAPSPRSRRRTAPRPGCASGSSGISTPPTIPKPSSSRSSTSSMTGP